LTRWLSSHSRRILSSATDSRDIAVERLRAEGYHSQSGQDKWIIEKLFPGRTAGVFVDIGAHDGVTYSNTCALEKMGWTGLAVEPLPPVYEELVRNRRCVTVRGCVAPAAGRRRFRAITGYSEMLSGLADEYHPRHLKRIAREMASHGGEVSDIDVECYDLNELLERHGIFQVDYLSIDVEGPELKILESIDFGRFDISVIGVENNYLDWRIPTLLVERGFDFHAVVGDEFYRNRRTAAW